MSIDNDVLACIRQRRSTHRFTAQQISPEQLDALLEAAVWAPSGFVPLRGCSSCHQPISLSSSVMGRSTRVRTFPNPPRGPRSGAPSFTAL